MNCFSSNLPRRLVSMPKIEPEIDFKAVFESASQPYVILSPQLMIIGVNDAYLRATNTKREKLLGRKLSDALPRNPDAVSTVAIENFTASLKNVLRSRKTDMMAVQRFDIADDRGGFEERFWSPVNTPILAKNGEIKYIIHRVEDVTEFMRLKRLGKEQTELTNQFREKAISMEAEVYTRVHEIQRQSKELEELNKQLQIARDEALKSSSFKSSFLANMSHEIRTPMNGILGMTDVILRNELEPEVREYVSVIRDAGRALLVVVNDILDFSKIEAGKLTLEMVDYKPVTLLDGVVSLMIEAARAKNIAVKTSVDPLIPTMLRGDPSRLRQILVNLTGNAIKFSDQGEIFVELVLEKKTKKNAFLRFSVTDPGIGLSAKEIETLFHPFVQSKLSTARKYGGTGLGLSISKQLVERMNGEIGIESEPGKGSTFWFRIKQPISDVAFDLPVPEEHLEALRNSAKIGNWQTAESHQNPEPSLPVVPRREVILVVEDHPVNQLVALLLLRDLGFEAHLADSALNALKLLSRRSYSAVFMDLQMPGVNGYEATKAIRASKAPQARSVPIIAMTAHAVEGIKEACLSAGMSDYISKPIDRAYLTEILAKWIPFYESQAVAEIPDFCEETSPIKIGYLASQYGVDNTKELTALFLDNMPSQLEG